MSKISLSAVAKAERVLAYSHVPLLWSFSFPHVIPLCKLLWWLSWLFLQQFLVASLATPYGFVMPCPWLQFTLCLAGFFQTARLRVGGEDVYHAVELPASQLVCHSPSLRPETHREEA